MKILVMVGVCTHLDAFLWDNKVNMEDGFVHVTDHTMILQEELEKVLLLLI